MSAVSKRRRPARSWTSSDDAVLLAHYARMGAAKLAKSRYFSPRRAKTQIWERARSLGLEYLPGGEEPQGVLTAWSSWEERVLRQHYSQMGPAALAESGRLPGRSRRAITKRAALLGVVFRGGTSHAVGKPWADGEVARLTAYLLDAGRGEEPPEVPGRTRAAVLSRLTAMRAGEGGSKIMRPWTAEEDAYLRANYAARRAAGCGRALRRSKAAVYNRVNVLRICAHPGKQD